MMWKGLHFHLIPASLLCQGDAQVCCLSAAVHLALATVKCTLASEKDTHAEVLCQEVAESNVYADATFCMSRDHAECHDVMFLHNHMLIITAGYSEEKPFTSSLH